MFKAIVFFGAVSGQQYGGEVVPGEKIEEWKQNWKQNIHAPTLNVVILPGEYEARETAQSAITHYNVYSIYNATVGIFGDTEARERMKNNPHLSLFDLDKERERLEWPFQ